MQSGRYNVETLKNCSQQEIIGEIFNSGISTAEEVDQDAGQGVGLSVVKQRVRDLAGVLRLRSRPQKFTAFSVHFKA